MDSIFTRRSVRVFSDKMIEDEKLEKILKAGMQAPTAMNQQPWEFIVVKGREKLQELSGYNPNAKPLHTAQVAIIVLGNKNYMKVPEYWQQDLSAATQNIMLQAAELDLGSVWLGTAPKEERVQYIKNLYSLADEVMPFSVIALGYPSANNANHFVDRYDESRVTIIE